MAHGSAAGAAAGYAHGAADGSGPEGSVWQRAAVRLRKAGSRQRSHPSNAVCCSGRAHRSLDAAKAEVDSLRAQLGAVKARAEEDTARLRAALDGEWPMGQGGKKAATESADTPRTRRRTQSWQHKRTRRRAAGRQLPRPRRLPQVRMLPTSPRPHDCRAHSRSWLLLLPAVVATSDRENDGEYARTVALFAAAVLDPPRQ